MNKEGNPKIAAIVAMNTDRVIGAKGALPWHLPADLKRFKDLTTDCAVIMGRKTYESLPAQYRPLPKRRNIIISRTPEAYNQQVESYGSIEGAISAINSDNKGFKPPIWIIGGAEIYALTEPLWDEVYLTLVHKKVAGDAYFPRFEENFDLIENTEFDGFSFHRYMRKD